MTGLLLFLAGAAAGGGVAVWAGRRREDEIRRRYARLLSFGMHEINTPVTAANMTVLNLVSGVFGDVAADHLKWIELARDQMGRLVALVGEMRDLVHLELHRDLRPALEPVVPTEILAEASAAVRRGFEQSRIELRVEEAKDLPRVRTDAERAARSLASLLFHARKFRVEGPVAVRALRRGSSVVFEIEYAGPGLAADEARASLELFYPARRRGDQILAATGLGLGLVREVMRLAGGDLEFSVGEKGRSRLALILPIESEVS